MFENEVKMKNGLLLQNFLFLVECNALLDGVLNEKELKKVKIEMIKNSSLIKRKSILNLKND